MNLELSPEQRDQLRGPQQFIQASFWVSPKEVAVLHFLESEAVWEDINRRIKERSAFDYKDDTIAVLAASFADVRELRRRKRKGASYWANWVAGKIRQGAQSVPGLDKEQLFASVSKVVISLLGPDENLIVDSSIPYGTATIALKRFFRKRNWRKRCSIISELKNK